MSLDAELMDMGIDTTPAPRPELKIVPRPLHPQWERFKPQIAEAMDGGFYSIEGVERGLADGRLMLWPAKDSAVITEILTYQGGERVIQALWACGKTEEIVALSPGIEAYGRLMGCTSFLVESREAWKRVLKPLGFELWSVTMRKGL
jgi:hypothetical protein